MIVFLHWGTEYDSCPDGDQEQLADELAAAGATAVIGAHAHVLQGAGWRDDGVYVAYGLSNYLWWRSFGNEQDDNGVLTLNFDGKAGDGGELRAVATWTTPAYRCRPPAPSGTASRPNGTRSGLCGAVRQPAG